MKRKLNFHFLLFGIAIVSGIVVSNFTVTYFDKPATRLMRLVTGGFFAKETKKTTKKSSQDCKIPKSYYPRLGKTVINPLYVANRAITAFNKAKKGIQKEKSQACFIKYVSWLRMNLRLSEKNGKKFGIWESDFPYPHGIYDLKVPWRSGMAQGIGLSALYKAYLLTGDDSYLVYSKYALNSFFVETKDGGVTYKDNEDTWWYEEYVGNRGAQPRVFNGAIYALIDIYDYWKATGDEDARILYEKGLNGIKTNLKRYDTGWWTNYDAIGNIATKHYHQDHIRLSRKLYDLTQDQFFLTYSKKWENYPDHYFMREFLRQKPDYHDIVILGLNILSCLVLIYFAAGLMFLLRKSMNAV